MNIDEINLWLKDTLSRPAAPRTVAEELDRCTSVEGSLSMWDELYRSLGIRFYNERRKQLTAPQMKALRAAATYGAKGGNALCFTNLNRAQIALQLMARVIDPGKINQGSFNLCGPAAVIVSLAKDHPIRYVDTCAQLADQGQVIINQWTITPKPDVRNHQPAERNQQADWVLCASVRADDRAITEMLYGSSGADQIFDFLCSCGYRRVIMRVDFPTKIVKAMPTGMLPPRFSNVDKTLLARTMADLAGGGWSIVMFTHGEMKDALSAVAAADQFRRLDPSLGEAAEESRHRTYQQHTTNLRTANISQRQLIWKALTGQVSAHMLHIMFVSNAYIQSNEIRLSCVNFGKHQQWVTLPLDAFVNKFIGFAAASDIQ
jgi:hypothetical protein